MPRLHPRPRLASPSVLPVRRAPTCSVWKVFTHALASKFRSRYNIPVSHSVRELEVGRRRQGMKAKRTQQGTRLKGKSPSQLIDARIEELRDWRGEVLNRVRTLIQQADPEVVEEWKWRGVPVWSHDGILCTGETYKSVVKMTFAKGAALKDPARLFNSSLEGNTRRAIDFHEDDKLDEDALKTLIRAAVTQNQSKARG